MRIQLFLACCLFWGTFCTAQELIGPDRIFPGTLASFEVVPEQEASWHIVPPSLDTGTYQVDSGFAKLYFASPECGRYTVVAGIIVDGTPKLLVKTFTNGEAETVLPVTSLETWVKAQLPVLVKSKNRASETRFVAECFEEIVRRIETKNIKTVQNAQAQLRITLTGALAQGSPTAVTDWIPFLTALSRQIEAELGESMNDLDAVKTALQTVANALKLPETDSITQETNTRTSGTNPRVFRSRMTR